jgi:thiosulfate reductase cytochrome b subunit
MTKIQRSTYRHKLPVRLGHWLNAFCFFILLMSGLNIFNAHRALYWGKISTFEAPAFSVMTKTDSDGQLHGVTQIGKYQFDTTGVLGASKNSNGKTIALGFPRWAIIPGYRSLAEARMWHFFFAWLFVINGLLFFLWAWLTKHYRNDLRPTVKDWRGIFISIWEHMRFKHPEGDAATRYNILQKLAYLSVIYILLPGLVLMGLCMSPHMGSVLGWLIDLVGGRQSARTLHFIFAGLMLAFIAIHLFMVLVSGPINQIRSMITGRYWIDEPASSAEKTGV